MANPNQEGTSNPAVLTGGVFGATVGETIVEPAGMHGFMSEQATGYGTPVSPSGPTQDLDASTATAGEVAETLCALLIALKAKGIIGA